MHLDWSKLLSTFQKIVWMAIIAGLAYIGEKGNDGGFIKDIWAAAKTASPFAAMFAVLVWGDERRERREAQRQCNDRTIDYIHSTNMQATAAEKLTGVVREMSNVMRDFAANSPTVIGKKRGKR